MMDLICHCKLKPQRVQVLPELAWRVEFAPRSPFQNPVREQRKPSLLFCVLFPVFFTYAQACMHTTCGDQKGMRDLLDLELEVLVSSLVLVLGTEP